MDFLEFVDIRDKVTDVLHMAITGSTDLPVKWPNLTFDGTTSHDAYLEVDVEITDADPASLGDATGRTRYRGYVLIRYHSKTGSGTRAGWSVLGAIGAAVYNLPDAPVRFQRPKPLPIIDGAAYYTQGVQIGYWTDVIP